MESEEIEFINFRPKKILVEDILKNIKIKTKNEIKNYSNYIFYNGGIDIDGLIFLSSYNETKLFLQEFEKLRIKDKKIQQQCFIKYNNDAIQFVQSILCYILESIIKEYYGINQNYSFNKIIIYGSSIPYFLKNQGYQINNLNIDDIDVATDNPEKLCQYIRNKLEEYNNNFITIYHKVKIKNIQVRKKQDKYFIRIDICDNCIGMHFLKRATVIDISLIKPFLSYSLPLQIEDIDKKILSTELLKKNNIYEINNLIYVQHPLSFIIGLYDKYAACVLNINKLCENDQKISLHKLETRINNLQFKKNIINLDIFESLYVSFNNINNVSKIKQMLINKLIEICGLEILEKLHL